MVRKTWTIISDCNSLRKGEGFPGGSAVKNLPGMQRSLSRRRFDPWVGKIPWRRAWQPTPVFLPNSMEFHGQRSLMGLSP